MSVEGRKAPPPQSWLPLRTSTGSRGRIRLKGRFFSRGKCASHFPKFLLPFLFSFFVSLFFPCLIRLTAFMNPTPSTPRTTRGRLGSRKSSGGAARRRAAQESAGKGVPCSQVSSSRWGLSRSGEYLRVESVRISRVTPERRGRDFNLLQRPMSVGVELVASAGARELRSKFAGTSKVNLARRSSVFLPNAAFQRCEGPAGPSRNCRTCMLAGNRLVLLGGGVCAEHARLHRKRAPANGRGRRTVAGTFAAEESAAPTAGGRSPSRRSNGL